MENDFSIRKEKNFEDFEIEFFNYNEIILPKGIICSSSLTATDRKHEGLKIEHGLLGQGGCYLFFDSYQWQQPTKFLSLYAGRTNLLKKRLANHWGAAENFVGLYQDSIASLDTSLMRKDIETTSIDKHKLLPTGVAWVAFWYINDKKERMFFEHELIYKCRPLYNKN